MINKNITHMNDNKDDLLASAWNDKLTEDYVEQWGELLLHKKIPEFCNLLPSEIVLDIGCGQGFVTKFLPGELLLEQLPAGYQQGMLQALTQQLKCLKSPQNSP